jgi:hypothetical protein
MAVGSIGWRDESGRGEEEDTVMVADDNQLKAATIKVNTTVTATTMTTATATLTATV